MEGELKDKIVLVTGGSRGIGAGIVRACCASGASVVFTARSQESVDAAQAQFAESGLVDVVGCVAHSADAESMAAAFDLAEARWGRPASIVVNNAATNPSMDRLIDIDLDVFDKIVSTNLRSYLAVAREGVRRMSEGGVVINISSVAAQRTMPGLGAYGVSKAAVDRMTTVLAAELGPKIRVVGVAPGLIRTKFSEALWKSEKSERRFSEHVPAGRLGEPDDIAQVVCFLASDRAAYLSGETVAVDGGWTAK